VPAESKLTNDPAVGADGENVMSGSGSPVPMVIDWELETVRLALSVTTRFTTKVFALVYV
jgi:hypothetical protein